MQKIQKSGNNVRFIQHHGISGLKFDSFFGWPVFHSMLPGHSFFVVQGQLFSLNQRNLRLISK
ncbi:MAG: hypothetical protein B6I19_04350 [Bacteroidetes bacterium 4572_114]|nr:MAG: hypothetical protein B6I19_04350 [Bacteroidetes bacterium 4572_114]